MQIRPATINDIPTLVEFGKAFVEESPHYRHRGFDPEQAEIHFKNLIKGSGVVFVVERDGQICGGYAGGIGEDWFNSQKIAFDYVMYVKPEFRLSRAAFLLVKTFVDWAKLMGADRIQCGTTTGVQSEGCVRLYEYFGFMEYGTVLDKEL